MCTVFKERSTRQLGGTARSITGGRANFHVEAGHYEEVPPNLVEKVLAANEREEEKAVS